MEMAERQEIRLWEANLGAEGSTRTGHRQGRRLGKRTENNGYAKPDLRPQGRLRQLGNCYLINREPI
jgi:hypothetical protein